MGKGSLPNRGGYKAYNRFYLAEVNKAGRALKDSGKASQRGHGLSAIAAKFGIPWVTYRRALEDEGEGRESARAQIFTCAEHVMLQKAKKALRLNGPDLKVALTATVHGLRAAMKAFKDACTGIADQKNTTLRREAKAQATVERARSLAGEGKVGHVRTAIASLEADVIACTKFHKLASHACDKLHALATKVDGAQGVIQQAHDTYTYAPETAGRDALPDPASVNPKLSVDVGTFTEQADDDLELEECVLGDLSDMAHETVGSRGKCYGSGFGCATRRTAEGVSGGKIGYEVEIGAAVPPDSPYIGTSGAASGQPTPSRGVAEPTGGPGDDSRRHVSGDGE
eukprot:jgi/Tetstr1/431818/TSEL_021312.t1